jgi:hypothetical protein
MTIQEAINKAIEGGYPTEWVDDLSYVTERLPFTHLLWPSTT